MAGVLCYFMGKLSHAVVNRTAESAKQKMASVLCCFLGLINLVVARSRKPRGT
jgi:hypothetical protein